MSFSPPVFVAYCPFCDWSVTYDLFFSSPDLEQVIQEHLDEHVEEMTAADA